MRASHDDFPALLAEALDRLQVDEYNVASSAEQLSVSSSQLVKFLKVEPKAITLVNRERQARGEAPLR